MVVGQLKFLPQVLLPGLIDDDHVIGDGRLEEHLHCPWSSQFLGVVVSDVAAAHPLHILALGHQESVMGLDLVGVVFPLPEGAGPGGSHHDVKDLRLRSQLPARC